VAEAVGIFAFGLVLGYAGWRLLLEYGKAFVRHPREVMTLEVVFQVLFRTGGPGYLAMLCLVCSAMIASGAAFMFVFELLHHLGRL
jgi:hypothetical protein